MANIRINLCYSARKVLIWDKTNNMNDFWRMFDSRSRETCRKIGSSIQKRGCRNTICWTASFLYGTPDCGNPLTTSVFARLFCGSRSSSGLGDAQLFLDSGGNIGQRSLIEVG